MPLDLKMGSVLTDPETRVVICCGAGGVGKRGTVLDGADQRLQPGGDGGLDLALGLDAPQCGLATLLDHGGDPARILLGQRQRFGRQVVATCRGFGLGVG